MYDSMVSARNRKVTAAAQQSIAVVASLFPKNVRDRIMEKNAAPATKSRKPCKELKFGESNDDSMDISDDAIKTSKIAELFPETTIMFADIAGARILETLLLHLKTIDLFTYACLFPSFCLLLAGFTAWSSAREPAQVFTLLETLFGAFDTFGTSGIKRITTV